MQVEIPALSLMWYTYIGRLQTSIVILSSLVEDVQAFPMMICKERTYEFLSVDLIDLFTLEY